MSGHVWLREERFEAALPLGSRSLRGLTVSQVHEVVRALRASQPRTASSGVQYATWVTAAWRILQWAEPASKLFWEMLSLQEAYLATTSKSADEIVAASSTVPAQVPLCHLVLFLWLHLPDAFAKVTSHPSSSYNIIWPSESPSSILAQGSSPTYSPCTGGGGGSGSGGSGGGARLVPGLKTGLSQLSFVHNNASYSSPHSPHHHHFQGPRSPRSYQLQAWSKVEAHHLTFFKKHMRDILWSLSMSSSMDSLEPKDKEGEQASMEIRPPHTSSSSSSSCMSIRREEFDALSYLCGGSEASHRSPGEAQGGAPSSSSSSSLGSRWDQEVEQLSSLVPYWQQHQAPSSDHPCPLDVIVAWMEEALCVNDKLYPPPPDPFTVASQASQSGPQHHMPTSSSANSANHMDVDHHHHHHHQQIVHHHPVPRPIQISLLHHTTVIKRGVAEVGNGERRLYINHCHESHIYVLGPVALACLVGCTDCTIVIGATAGLVRVAHCERITLITCCRRLVISNCLDSVFFIFTAFPPVLVGENRGCRLAPYNTCYPGLRAHLRAARLPSASPPAVNCWNSPIDLSSANVAWMMPPQTTSPSSSALGPPTHDTSVASPSSSGSSLSASGGGGGGGDWILPVESFHTMSVPVAGGEEEEGDGQQEQQPPLENPFALPQEYTAILRERSAVVESLRARLIEELSDGQRGQVEEYLRAKFLEWLWSSGQMRQVLELIHLASPGSSSSSSNGSGSGSGTQPPPPS